MTKDYTAAAKLDSLAGWLVALSAFIAGFVAFGVMYSFGAFFTSMEEEFHTSRAATSAFFAATGMLFYFFGSIAGQLSDRFGPRRIVLAGAVIMGTGLTFTAAAPQMWTGYLTYGVGAGIGAACSYIPTLALVGGWFTHHRTTALGLAAAGTGCGTLLMPPVAAALIQAYGWRTAYALFAASSFVLLLICAFLARPSPVAQEHQTMELRAVVRSRPFTLLYASWVLATTGLTMAMVFLVPFALDMGVAPLAASALISIIGGMSILGRGGIGFISQKVGLVRLYKLSVLIMAASYLLWLPFNGYGWLVAFAATLGFGYGVRIALTPVVLIKFFGLGNLGTLLGVFFTASAISAVCGPLVAGLIIDWTGSYHWGVAFALGMGVLGFIGVAPLQREGSEPTPPIKSSDQARPPCPLDPGSAEHPRHDCRPPGGFSIPWRCMSRYNECTWSPDADRPRRPGGVRTRTYPHPDRRGARACQGPRREDGPAAGDDAAPDQGSATPSRCWRTDA